MLSMDFETASSVDLFTHGLDNYALGADTHILCLAYSLDGEPPELWLPGDAVPQAFYTETEFWAWNARFERKLWQLMVEDHGFPDIPLANWRCTMYQAACNNMPAALGNAARCLNVDQQKLKRGRELIKLLCVPLADGSFNKDPDTLDEMYEYCLQDVRTEQDCGRQMRQPTADEWADYYANERINDRGVLVDCEIAIGAQAYAAVEEAELIAQIQATTEGVVTKARGEKLKEWVVERLTDDQCELLVKYRDGEKKLSLDRYNRARLLALDDLDPDVSQVVEASDFAQRSSVGKFKAMQLLADEEDGRVRGVLVANGAPASGRYSSRGLQVHNFPRTVMDDPEEVKADLVDNIMPEDIVDYYELPMMTLLSRMLRSALIPAPGKVFLVSDWSAIEGRVAPWLCDTQMGVKKLDMYAEGKPVYEITAGATFRKAPEEVTKDERQVGKVQELAFQFGGGANAFLAMARNYGLKVSKVEAEQYKGAWRRINPWAQTMWNDMERAALLAVRKPGKLYTAGRLTYFAVDGVLAGGVTLFCQLPCGRLLTYPDTRVEMKETPWGDEQPGLTYLRSSFAPKATEKEWPRTNLWGGLLFENAVQGTAASLLRYAVRACDDVDLDVVFHVHDELVVESTGGGEAEAALFNVMNTPPAWAVDLPLAADVDVMERFGK